MVLNPAVKLVRLGEVGESVQTSIPILNLSKRQRPTVEPAAVDLLRFSVATFDYVQPLLGVSAWGKRTRIQFKHSIARLQATTMDPEAPELIEDDGRLHKARFPTVYASLDK